MLARFPSLHPTRYQRAFPRYQYRYLAGSGPGSTERPSLTRNLLYLVMRTVTCTPVRLGPGLAHTLAKVGAGGLLLQGLGLYAPGDWVEDSHSSLIFIGSDTCLLPLPNFWVKHSPPAGLFRHFYHIPLCGSTHTGDTTMFSVSLPPLHKHIPFLFCI